MVGEASLQTTNSIYKQLSTTRGKMIEKLIYIEWCDVISSGSEWTEESKLGEWIDDTQWVIKQCGFIIRETPKYILLAGHIKMEDSFTETQYGHLQKIPKGLILKRVDLTKHIK